MAEPIIRVSQVGKSYRRNKTSFQVLKDITLTVQKGKIVALLGKSGCGKSTLLSMIGGFLSPDQGEIFINEKRVTKPKRNCVTLFQQHNLLPWRTVLDNVLLGLDHKENRIELAKESLAFVGLKQHMNSYPRELSGGIAQRVAIARVLAIQPDVILMDEPFAALDTFNRYHLQDELIRLQEKRNLSVLLVTHDIDEAVYLADKIIIMNSNPGEIYETIDIDLAKPRNRSHPDFHYYRGKILDRFKLSGEENNPEYNI